MRAELPIWSTAYYFSVLPKPLQLNPLLFTENLLCVENQVNVLGNPKRYDTSLSLQFDWRPKSFEIKIGEKNSISFDTLGHRFKPLLIAEEMLFCGKTGFFFSLIERF